MPYIGNNHIVGDHVNNFKVLDDISSYTETFDGTATSVVSVANDTIRIPNHRFIQGQRVIYTHGGGSNIPGLSSASPYYVIFDTNHTFKLATSVSNATSGIAVNITGVAPGGTSHTINASFDGFNKKFKITHGAGKSARFTNPSQISIAINNVIQRPNLDANNFSDGFAIEHKEIIVFKTAPGATEVFWGNLIGETIESFDTSDLKIDNFTGDGSTTEFTLSKVIPNNESVMVSLDGVLQHPTDSSTTRSYTVIANILSFTAAPANGVEIQARHLGFAGAATGEVTGFYGRSGNVNLTSSDHITTGDITSRNINSSGIITASSFSGPLNATTGSFSGDVSIGGTLTYEDVKNIDSVGIITARDGIEVTGGDIKVGSGVTIERNGQATFTGIVTFGSGSTTIDNNVVNVGTALTLGHTQGLQFHTQNLHSAGFEINQINASGIITAASFSGSTKTGLGTALNSDETNPLSNIFYTDNILGIGATVTVDHPSSAAAAFTRYGDIRVDDTADLIIADGDDFIPDVLGLADFGTLGGGASQGRIRVNTITNSAANGAPTVQNGLIVSGITTFNDNVNLLDNDKLQIGTSQDLSLYHDGNHSYIDDTGTGNLKARSNNFRISNADESKISATFQPAAGVELFYDNTSRMSTASYGIAVNGNILLQEELVHIGDTDTKIRFPAADTITAETAGSERIRITSGGMLIKGHTGSAGQIDTQLNSQNQFHGNDRKGGIRIADFSDSPYPASLQFVKSRNATIGQNTILQDGDRMGSIYWGGANGTNYQPGAFLTALTDGTVSSSAMPTAIIFGTNEGNNLVERVRIKPDGKVGIGTDNPSGALHISSGTSGDCELIIEADADNNNESDNPRIIFRQDGGNDQNAIGVENNELVFSSSTSSNGGLVFKVGSSLPYTNATEVMRVQPNGEIAMRSSGACSDALANLHVQNDSFRVSNDSDGADTTYLKITAHTSGTDNDRWSIGYVSNNIDEWHIRKDGTAYFGGSVNAGRTRNDANSPTNYYHHGAFALAAYSGRTDDPVNYRTGIYMRAWDAGDNGDRNIIYYTNSDSDTTTVDYDQHQKFGVKANGTIWSNSIYVGRIESDEATPNSVYTGGNGTGFFCYPTSSSQSSQIRARTSNVNNEYTIYTDTGGGVNFKLSSGGRLYRDNTTEYSPADYAEMFEWKDGNTSSEVRTGMTVVLEDEMIRPATSSDDTSKIIGVVSANPVIIGDAAPLSYKDKHLKDAYGGWVYDDGKEMLIWNKFGSDFIDGKKVTRPQPDPTDCNCNPDFSIPVADIETEKAKGNVPQAAIDQNIRMTVNSRLPNPDYDPTKTYVPRMDRKEWDAIGLLGKIVVRRGQPIGANWILMKSNVGTDPNDSNIVLDKYLVR